MYIGNQPVLQTSEFREEFTATAGQTVFNTLGFAYSTDSAFVEIFRNGVLLGTEDYTLGTDGTTVTLSDACSLNDIVLVKGRRAITQGISITESRTEYTWQSGDTYVQLNADIVPGYADVYLNGVKLPSAEFSIDTGTKRVTFTTTPSIGDEVSVVYRTETSSLVALPLKDSAGNNVLSETAGEVSLSLSGDLDVTGELTLGTALAVAEGGTGVTALSSLDAADLGSGAATDGYVLTADGAGNAAWEAASGVSLPIDLLSSGASIRKSDGTTDVLSESSGAVTLDNASLGNAVVFPAGHVIQVVQNVYNASDNTTSLNFEDITNFSVNITPTSSLNKIFIVATGYVVNSLVIGANVRADHQLVRVNTPSDSVLVDVSSLSAESSSGGLQIKGSLAISYLESLSFWTSGSLTYKVQHKTTNTSSTASLFRGRITVMEIQG